MSTILSHLLSRLTISAAAFGFLMSAGALAFADDPAEGGAMNFKDDKNPEYVGTVARKNPWEFIHKARFGRPGAVMVGLVALPTQDIIDILAYGQTLPAK